MLFAVHRPLRRYNLHKHSDFLRSRSLQTLLQLVTRGVTSEQGNRNF